MTKYVITLQNRASGENFTVEAIGRNGECVCKIHKRVLEKHPGTFVRKTKRV